MTDFAAVVEALARSTVEVRSPGGAGSGVVWRPGVVVTNAHVARGTRARVRLWDQREVDAGIAARDPSRDLVALDVAAGDVAPIAVRDAASLRIGELVVAVGNPLGIRGAAAMGIVHAFGPREAPPHRRWIRADVRLAPGNSGGPLADASGRVVGVNTMVAHGLGLAIPSTAVERFLSDRGRRPYIGVMTRPVVVARGDRRRAALVVLEVRGKSPAAEAGLEVGDVLLAVSGQPLDAPDALARTVQDAEPGSSIAVDLVRGGHLLSREIVVRAV